jgi:predicted metal-binding protein
MPTPSGLKKLRAKFKPTKSKLMSSWSCHCNSRMGQVIWKLLIKKKILKTCRFTRLMSSMDPQYRLTHNFKLTKKNRTNLFKMSSRREFKNGEKHR